jgi:predicted Zn-dependent peptidase
LRKYYIFLAICLLFLNCKTLYYSSLFKKIPGKQTLITKDITSKKNYQEELTLKNSFKILLKESDMKNVRLCFYLKNSPLYHTQINAGTEKIILSYLKNSMIEKFNLRIGRIPEIEIYSNKDVTSLSFYIDKENVKTAINIIAESVRISSFNPAEINRLKDELLNYFNKRQKDLIVNLDSKFERHVFKSSPVQIPFDGNSISLKVISQNDISAYYRNNFNVKRMLLFIYGGISKKDFLISDFAAFENLNFNMNPADLSYEKIESKIFNTQPQYYPNPSKDNMSYYEAIYDSPSFLDDDYFAFLIANRIMSDNFSACSEATEPVSCSPGMLNISNFGKLQFKSDESNTVDMLLSFKKILAKTKKGTGIFYYWKDSVDNIVRDYGKQDENHINIRTLSSVIDGYKKNIFEDFNFTNINSRDKEINFISIYFLLNQMLDSSLIKERIDTITENDILKIYQKYFNNFAWSVMSSDKMINNLSVDFFSAAR